MYLNILKCPKKPDKPECMRWKEQEVENRGREDPQAGIREEEGITNLLPAWQ